VTTMEETRQPIDYATLQRLDEEAEVLLRAGR
jgi:hypothetical protein